MSTPVVVKLWNCIVPSGIPVGIRVIVRSGEAQREPADLWLSMWSIGDLFCEMRTLSFFKVIGGMIGWIEVDFDTQQPIFKIHLNNLSPGSKMEAASRSVGTKAVVR